MSLPTETGKVSKHNQRKLLSYMEVAVAGKLSRKWAGSQVIRGLPDRSLSKDTEDMLAKRELLYIADQTRLTRR